MKPIDEIRQAFLKIHHVATKQSDRAYMSIPADPERDADMIVDAAIDELEQLRQQSALLAECVGVMERYVAHDGDCGINCMGITKCDCGFDQTLAALKARIEALKGEE